MIITDEAILRTPCSDILPEEIGPLKDQLERELAHSATLGRKGIGLAASQIGVFKKYAIIRVDEKYSVDIANCNITSGYNNKIFESEGCLSFPGRFEQTMRYQEIYVTNNLVEPYSFIACGLLAVVVQHELDHTNGILLPDLAIPKKTAKLRPNDSCFCGSGKKLKKCCKDGF